MTQFLDKLSFSKRIFCIVMLPLSGLFIFSYVFISDHLAATRQIEREIRSVTELTQLGTLIADAVHEWQKERGRSSGYLGSQGKNFATEIRQQYASTDTVVSRLQAAIAQNSYSDQPKEFHSQLKSAIDRMEQIPSLRDQVVDLKIAAGDAVGQYTATITAFLEVIDIAAGLTENSRISMLLVSYTSFLRAKENMGIERAVLSNAFGADQFKNDFFKRYCTVLANQDSYLQAFRSHGESRHWTIYEQTVQGLSVDKVAEFEQTAFAKAETGGFGVRPEDWFREITAKIDLMKQVEDQIAQDVLASSATITASSRSRFYSLIAVAATIISLSFAISLWLASATKRSLRVSVESLNIGVNEVATAAGEVSKASASMASAATEQSSSLSLTMDALKTINEVTINNGNLASEANSITAEARSMVDRSLKEMHGLQTAMDDIRSSSDEISAIIKTIDEIAFQTNILALNAAVEAARAGEAGAGFAVVADEVRNLAQRSARAASDTTRKIEDSIQRAHNGTRISAAVGEVLTAIVEKVRSVDVVVSRIDAASKEQLSAIANIQTAVYEQESVVTSAAASTEQTAAASEELYGQAQDMQQSLRRLALQAGVSAKQLAVATTALATRRPTVATKPALRTTTPKPADARNDLAFWN